MSLMTTAPDLTAFQSWLDHRDTATELLSVVPAHGLAATLNLPAASVPSEALPPLWHWLHFLEIGRASCRERVSSPV